MSRPADIRAAILTRLATVTTGSPRVYAWDAMASDLGANAIVVGVPSSVFGRGGDPLAPDVEVGRWGWTLTWPITVYVARTPDAASTGLCDDITEDLVQALFSDRTLGGTCLASTLASVEADDSDQDDQARRHVLAFELVTTVHVNE